MLTPNFKLDEGTILVTGAAGFIGAHLVLHLLERCPSVHVVGVDNLNDYYDVSLKLHRLGRIESAFGAASAAKASWRFLKGDIADAEFLESVFREHRPVAVVNLAAQAGVRYSIDNPQAYIRSNLIGFFNVLECCRHNPVRHLVYASSSSVYGNSAKIPFSTDDKVDEPVSLYAATKKSDELLAHSYSKLFDIPATGLRFFTVYGPAGRPDMAYFSFTDKLLKGETIRIFNYGNCRRDFTYIDDITEGIVRVLCCAPERRQGADGLPVPPYRLYNIGNNAPENLLEFVDVLRQELTAAGVLAADYDFAAHTKLVPMQAGDVETTYADVTPLERDFGYRPATTLRDGLRAFALWYRDFYGTGK